MSESRIHCSDCNSALPPSGICQECATAIGGAVVERPRVEGAPEIEGYEIRQLLGEGGMGSVYLAEDVTLRRKVAIKVIRSGSESQQLRERFMREAQVMATIEDPNVVRLYSFGANGGTSWLVMEYVEGESLAQLIQRRGGLATPEVCRIGIQACYGLRTAAGKGIVHRDIKPGNILIDERQTVRVADFGLAKQTAKGDSALTADGMVVGTPYYMPPEQAEGKELTSASDIYSLGLVLYELLTGERAFSGSSPLAVIARQLHDPLPKPKRRAGVKRPMMQLLRRMTAKDPAQRPSFDRVVDELESIARWHSHGYEAIGWKQVASVAVYVLGLFVAGTLIGDLAPIVGILKPLLIGVGAAAFGFAFSFVILPRAGRPRGRS